MKEESAIGAHMPLMKNISIEFLVNHIWNKDF